MDDECDSNEIEQYKYLDPHNWFFAFTMIYNNEEFVADKYGDQSILREANYLATYYEQKADKGKSINFIIQGTQLNDQTDLL